MQNKQAREINKQRQHACQKFPLSQQKQKGFCIVQSYTISLHLAGCILSGSSCHLRSSLAVASRKLEIDERHLPQVGTWIYGYVAWIYIIIHVCIIYIHTLYTCSCAKLTLSSNSPLGHVAVQRIRGAILVPPRTLEPGHPVEEHGVQAQVGRGGRGCTKRRGEQVGSASER